MQIDITLTLKVASMIASAGFGALGLLTNYKGSDGKITRWGKIALSGIAVSALLSLTLQWLEWDKAQAAAVEAQQRAKELTASLGSILATAQQTVGHQQDTLTQAHDLATRLEASTRLGEQLGARMASGLEQGRRTLANTQALNESLATSLEQQRALQGNVMRAYYALEPLTIEYELEYDAREPLFRAYLDRTRGAHLPDPGDDREEDEFAPPIDMGEQAPRDSGDEAPVRELLLTDATVFDFSTSEAKRDVEFLCAGSDWATTADADHPPKGKLFQDLSLTFDSEAWVFSKRVRCENPLRRGNDWRVVSAVDLIGHTWKWRPFSRARVQPKLLWLRLHFAYNAGNESHVIAIKDDQPPISAADVGLADVFRAATPPPRSPASSPSH